LTQAGMEKGGQKPSPFSPRATPPGIDGQPHGGPHPAVSHRPRRQLLSSAVLLLLAEKPRHGYALTNAFADLGLGDMDRPRIYRTLAELEGNGLVKVWDETSSTGHVRRVYSVTDLGHQSLSTAAEMIAHERRALDDFLERYRRVSSGSPRRARVQPTTLEPRAGRRMGDGRGGH
jgi:PadR family transcriptional regulator PadR